MEATLIIKLPDGSTKTIELQNVTMSTMWGMPGGSPIMPMYDVFDINNPPAPVCSLTLGGQIKNVSLSSIV
jgi:hypothetical protein